ncbi:hypothetical protein C8T65DRAFT_743031 [Cerioporus squamosus]|nr:hypothetical protein C8T65DRAFT_743031 [Cerioporus squamosus]
MLTIPGDKLLQTPLTAQLWVKVGSKRRKRPQVWRLARVAYCLLTHHHPLPPPLPLLSPHYASRVEGVKANGQKPITSFFGKPKKTGESSKSNDDKVDGDKSDDEPPADDKPVEDDPSDPDAGDADEEQVKGSGIENSDLPPIHDIPAIFSDLVSHIPEIKAVAEH